VIVVPFHICGSQLGSTDRARGPIINGINDAFTNIRSMMQLVVHLWVTCRFVTFLGIDELRLMPVNHCGNHSGFFKIGALWAS